MGILWKTSILMVLIVSGFSAISYSQTYSLGVGLNYAPAEISNGVGLNSVFEYRTDIHYAFRLNLRAVLGSFEDKYYPGMSYFLPGLEGSFVYYPVKWPIEPYFGAGIGYFYPIRFQVEVYRDATDTRYLFRLAAPRWPMIHFRQPNANVHIQTVRGGRCELRRFGHVQKPVRPFVL
jgi:hypothetical protein